MFKSLTTKFMVAGFVATSTVSATYAAPADDVIFDMSSQILKDLKSNSGLRSGNKAAVGSYVEANVLPRVNMRRWTSMAVGPAWDKATSAEQEDLMQTMRRYFVNTYASRLAGNTVTAIDVYPANGNEVKTLVKHSTGKTDNVTYYMECSGGCRVYDVAVGGVKASNTYRSQFKNAVNRGGVPALIAELKAKAK